MFAGAEGKGEVSPRADFLTLAPRVAIRRALPQGLQLAALAEVPVVGQDRTDLIFALYLGWAAPQ